MLGVSISLASAALLSGVSFSPLSLFAANEPGWLYDNSDISTLFQDAAGATPVTSVGQPVGLQLDKSKGLILGPELVANGDFSVGSTGWTLGAGWSVSDGVATKTSGSSSALNQSGAIIGGASYRVTVTITNRTGGSLYWRLGNTVNLQVMSANGSYTFIIQGAATGNYIGIFADSVFNGSIDNISVKELPGTHRTQSIAASRPYYSRLPVTGRRNLLTYTEQFDNDTWIKSNATATLSGTLAGLPAYRITESTASGTHGIGQNITVVASAAHTIHAVVKADGRSLLRMGCAVLGKYAVFDLSTGAVQYTDTGVTASIVSVNDGVFRCAVTLTPASTSASILLRMQSSTAEWPGSGVYTGDGASGVLATAMQVEKGSTATNYQKVVSLYDITEAGVTTAYGLYYDGVDDFLVTPTITPGTDKVQVFAGVRKLSDAASAMVAELGADASAGTFTLQAPETTTYLYRWLSRGSLATQVRLIGSSYAAPQTAVLTGIGDISGDVSRFRFNGGTGGEVLTDQGTGNYLAYPVYFGRRAGTLLPFNGYTFREVGRFGPNLDDATIANVENWVNQNTGAY